MTAGTAALARIERGIDGTIRVRAEGVDAIEIASVGGAWRVRGLGDPGGWRAERCPVARGFRVRPDGTPEDEAACTTRMPAAEGEAALGRHVFLADGRLFRLVERGGRDPRFELLPWEAPGPYLVARPGAADWRIETQPAGAALGDLRELWVLMALEILDSDEPLGEARSNDDAP
jgi:hypothetical protein